MKRAMRRCGLAVAVLGLVAGAAPARASLVYGFNSGNYTSADPPYTRAMHLQITITLDQALPSGMTTPDVETLPGFSLTWNDGLATHGPAGVGFQTLTLTTNGAGAVTNWDFSFSDGDAAAAGNNVSGTGFVQVLDFPRDATAFRLDGVGTWTVTEIPPNVVPEPSTLAMACTAVVLGLGYGWRKRRRAAGT